MIDKYTGREIVSPADKLTDDETQAIRNNVADFLAGISIIRRSATDKQWVNLLVALDEDARNLARRFFNEMAEFPMRDYLSTQNDSAPCGQSTNK